MPRRIAIIGAGSVGAALTTGLAGVGHDVRVGVRAPDDPKHDALRSQATVTTLAEASTGAEVVILAVPADAVEASIAALDLGAGQVLLDAANAVRQPVPGGHDTVGDLTASLLPEGVSLAKAFNTIGAEHMVGARPDGTRPFLPLAGDDDATAVAQELADGLGFDTVVVGDRSAFHHLEAHAALWIHLAFACGWGRNFAFEVVRR